MVPMTRVDHAIPSPPAAVIATFLADMAAASERTFPAWKELLVDGIAEPAPEGGALYDQIIVHQPLEDFYFAGVVALEAVKIRRYLGPNNASELLAALADQIDHAAGRNDRAVSDLVFFMIGRVELETGVELMTMPYDKIVEMILRRIGLDQHEATRTLMDDFAFRHCLGEPLALGVPQYWKAFTAKLKRDARHNAQTKSAAE
jgi:hypothetical protein